ncbi:MAG: HD domain-containing protein [Pseudomonadota bacterium]
MSVELVAAEDALRISTNIANGHGLPDSDLTKQVAEAAQTVSSLSGAKLRSILEEIILGREASTALQWLHDAGVLAKLLPEVEATVEFVQEVGRKHKDVWEHTKQVVMQTPPEPNIRWAALFHDVGKVPTRIIEKSGKVTFHRHAEVGARMFCGVARRLMFPKSMSEKITFLVLNHLRASQYDETWTDSAVRRFDREMREYLPELFKLSRADVTSARKNKCEAARQRIDELESRVMALRETDSHKPLLPSGLGDEIMIRFGLQPGRLVGELKKELERAIEKNELEAQREALYYLDYIEAHEKDRF